MFSFLVLLIWEGWGRARGCYLYVFKGTFFPMDLMILSTIDNDVSDHLWWTLLAVKQTLQFKTITCHMRPRPLPRAASRLGCSNVAIIAQNCIFCLPVEGFCPCGWNEWSSSVLSPSGHCLWIPSYKLPPETCANSRGSLIIAVKWKWIVPLQLQQLCPRAGDVLRHLSLQYHCLVPLESGLHVSKLGPGEDPVNQRQEHIKVSVDAALMSRLVKRGLFCTRCHHSYVKRSNFSEHFVRWTMARILVFICSSTIIATLIPNSYL